MPASDSGSNNDYTFGTRNVHTKVRSKALIGETVDTEMNKNYPIE